MKKNITLALVMTSCIITEAVKADFFFGQTKNLGSVVNSPSSDYGTCFSADGLEMYFTSERPGGFGSGDIWISTRQSIDDPWGPPVNLGEPVNGPYSESYPSLSSDGLTMYFSDSYSSVPRPGGLGGGDIWITTRPSRSESWSAPVNLGAPINNSNLDMSPTISGDGLTLVFTSRDRTGGNGSWDVWISTRDSVKGSWSQPVNPGTVINSSNWDGECGISWDGLALFYGTGRTGIVGAADIWMSTRKTLTSRWAVGVNLSAVVNSSSNDGTARLSVDMRTLYFCSDRPGGLGSYDLYETPIITIVDFNGDGRSDIEDIVRMIESWGQSNPAMDIGPGPWGDGIIDAADLEAFMSRWGEPLEDPTLAAHWAFDETQGASAHESVSGTESLVIGDPLWQPSGGQVDGAIQLDGLDDYVDTDFIVIPSAGVFSIVAWVKGGEPGQAVLSQANGVSWLCIDAVDGNLMTELTNFGRSSVGPMLSQAKITDGNWHRIGFVWDGSCRHLYADGVEVAVDVSALSDLESAAGGLYFGVGSKLDAGTFFSGLIDDIRIYNRAVSP